MKILSFHYPILNINNHFDLTLSRKMIHTFTVPYGAHWVHPFLDQARHRQANKPTAEKRKQKNVIPVDCGWCAKVPLDRGESHEPVSCNWALGVRWPMSLYPGLKAHPLDLVWLLKPDRLVFGLENVWRGRLFLASGTVLFSKLWTELFIIRMITKFSSSRVAFAENSSTFHSCIFVFFVIFCQWTYSFIHTAFLQCIFKRLFVCV